MPEDKDRSDYIQKWESDLINGLRQEAFAVKDCFTKYSVQSAGFVIVTLVFVVRFQLETPDVAFISIPVLLVLMTVQRMGTHKYATASRLGAYELHLQRTRRISDDSSYDWTPRMREIGWEEAMRAWRIVTATVFESVYGKPSRFPLVSVERLPEATMEKYVWYEPTRTIHSSLPQNDSEKSGLTQSPHVAYYPGGYLGTMLDILSVQMIVPFLILISFPLSSNNAEPLLPFVKQEWVGWSVVVIMGVAIIMHLRQVYARKRVIENGLLSIQASCILWQAVVIAHFRALRAVGNDEDSVPEVLQYEGYTIQLADQAIKLAERVDDIHGWMETNK
jgi:hypothetical protein